VPVWDSLYGRYAFLTIAEFQKLLGGATIPGRTLIPGGSILFSGVQGSDALLLDIDRRNVLHWRVQVPPPVVGSECEDLGGALLSEALYVCRANERDNNGTWVRIEIKTQ
jgi:hypothetical protein